MNKNPRHLAQALWETARNKKGKELEKIIRRFVKFLARENKLSWQDKIGEHLRNHAARQEGIALIEIETARPLKISFKKILEKKLNGKIELKERRDPALLGGFIVKCGDAIWDGTVKKQLQLLKSKLAN